MPNYVVKQVKKGPEAGKWGVFKGGTLVLAYRSQAAATKDANRRNKEQGN